MRNDQSKTSKTQRGGDTSRSSSQGQKQSSGGQISQRRRGEPEMDDASHSPVKDKKAPRKRRS